MLYIEPGEMNEAWMAKKLSIPLPKNTLFKRIEVAILCRRLSLFLSAVLSCYQLL